MSALRSVDPGAVTSYRVYHLLPGLCLLTLRTPGGTTRGLCTSRAARRLIGAIFRAGY